MEEKYLKYKYLKYKYKFNLLRMGGAIYDEIKEELTIKYPTIRHEAERQLLSIITAGKSSIYYSFLLQQITVKFNSVEDLGKDIKFLIRDYAKNPYLSAMKKLYEKISIGQIDKTTKEFKDKYNSIINLIEFMINLNVNYKNLIYWKENKIQIRDYNLAPAKVYNVKFVGYIALGFLDTIYEHNTHTDPSEPSDNTYPDRHWTITFKWDFTESKSQGSTPTTYTLEIYTPHNPDTHIESANDFNLYMFLNL